MTPGQKRNEALEAMRAAASAGWTDQQIKDAGKEALIMLGVDPSQSETIAGDIWQERFEIAGPC